MTTLLFYALIGLLALVAVGVALLPLALFSGLRAHATAADHQAEAKRIRQALAE